MNNKAKSLVDVIGPWSEIKLDIIKEYAQAYSSILSNQKSPSLHHAYIDGFAGPGVNLSRSSGRYVLGSPLNALLINPPFCEYHLIDADGDKVSLLRQLIRECPHCDKVTVYQGDCNAILTEEVFPNMRWSDYRRALCLLDPYAMHLDWRVIRSAGKMKTIDIFLNFTSMDICRNALRKRPVEDAVRRMNTLWGDDSWKQSLFDWNLNLFGASDSQKLSNPQIARIFTDRIRKVAGFRYVSRPLAIRNSKRNILYFLVFASQKLVATDIVEDIFRKYEKKGA